MAVRYEEVDGNSIDEVGPKLISAARETGCILATTLLGIPLVVRPEDSFAELRVAYFALLVDRHEDQQPADRQINRRRHKRRHAIHEESPGRRKTDYTIPIRVQLQPNPESSS